MRITVSLELDEHQYEVSIETDQSVHPARLTRVATDALLELRRPENVEEVVRQSTRRP